MDKDTLILVPFIWIAVGSFVLAIDRKHVRRSFNWSKYNTPFWARFNFGLYQWTVIILFPIWLSQRLLK